ncbi:hypothetical protein [Flavobacterium sp.]|uniref:hypothetical protein n=1 Tax=Flavobacterium sp. TaxID=239 RepID=UPI00286D9F1D|nr:hypothetical protein [Flavobacterium sp.]
MSINYKPEKEFNIYKLKEKDTLKSIALFLNKSEWEVAGFHNCYAKGNEIIGYEFPKELKNLYLNPNISEKHLEGVPKAKFESGYLNIKPFEKINYKVKFISTIEDEINTIEYDVCIKHKESKQEYHLFEIDRISKVYVNNQLADTKIEELAQKVSEVLFPIVVFVNPNGKWEEIYNHQDISKRWVNNKSKILSEFQGDEFENYCIAFEQSITTKASLTESLQNDWFLNAYFGEIYANSYQNLVTEFTLNFPLQTDSNAIQYKVLQTIDEYLDSEDNISIERKGIVVYDNFDNTAGNFYSNYALNTKDNSIKMIRLECNIEGNSTEKLQIAIVTLTDKK